MPLKYTIDLFKEKANAIHCYKYDYSKVEYKDCKTKVCIICPEHGEFWQTPDKHLRGQGCPKCKSQSTHNRCSSTLKDFINIATKIHNNKYDYSKVMYYNNKTKVCIVCPEHGEFWQIPHSHLNGSGCPKCGKINMWKTRGKITNSAFIEKATKIHNKKYDYSKVNYDGYKTKVCIICPEHGEFWQTPDKHLQGHGCPECNKSGHIIETDIFMMIKNEFKNEECIRNYKNKDILGLQEIDIFFPKYKIGIEIQGIQHFIPKYFHKGQKKTEGKQILKEIQERDMRKLNKCKTNGIKLFYFSKFKGNTFLGEKLYHSYEEMIKDIRDGMRKYGI